MVRSTVRRLRSTASRYARDPIYLAVLRARAQRPLRLWAFNQFGRYSMLHRPDWVRGAHKIDIGDFVVILHGIWLTVEQEALDKPGSVIRIGDRVGIRPYCTISAAESITIEDDVIIAAFSTIIDSDHTFAAGIPNVLKNPLAVAPIRIGRGTWIAERCAILRGSDIGTCCIIGANSVVRGPIPDYSIAVGAPARVVGSTRHWFTEAADPAP